MSAPLAALSASVITLASLTIHWLAFATSDSIDAISGRVEELPEIGISMSVPFEVKNIQNYYFELDFK
jgi:hypothetical protein